MERYDIKNKVIVVVCMLYFGDMISISPFLEILRRAADGSKIVLVMDHRFVDAVAYNPHIDTVIPVDRKRCGVSGTWKLGRELRHLHPDLLIVLHGTGRTSVLAMAMHTKKWVGDVGLLTDRFFMTKKFLVERRDCHAAEKFVSVLSELGIEDITHEKMKIYTCDEWEQGARRFFSSFGIVKEQKIAGFSVGSSTSEKNWPAEKYGEVADYFYAKGYRPVFFGTSDETGLIKNALSGRQCRNDAITAAGRLSMGEFMAAVTWCDVAFTNDSGPMYVFDAGGVPTIALFGPSNAKLHHPLGVRSTALASTDMPWEQDHVNHTIRDGNYVPIDSISVKEVIRAGLWAIGERKTDEYAHHYKCLQKREK